MEPTALIDQTLRSSGKSNNKNYIGVRRLIMAKKYCIFGAGPSGLYTAWRLINSGKLSSDDTLQIYEWGDYDFSDTGKGRKPAGRICSHFYQNNKENSYIEIGGMRFLEWDDTSHEGHQLVTKTIQMLGMDDQVIPFNTTKNPLFYLRGKHFYQNELKGNGGNLTAPYGTPGNNENSPDKLFAEISKLITQDSKLETRKDQCEFYANGQLPGSFNSFVYNGNDVAGNIGYWNLFYDQAGNEGFNYAADAGGYSSNVINWNAANAAIYNGEFAPGGKFKTLKTGYSSLFVQLLQQTLDEAKKKNITVTLTAKTRLHSIWLDNEKPVFRLATADDPEQANGQPQTADYVFLAMPPQSVELIAQATRYNQPENGIDFLNNNKVRNYLDSVEEQPSYKVAMFFDSQWWLDSSYPPKLDADNSETNIFGPTITDLPLRQVYYFGNNANAASTPVYGILASYDDMRFTGFWKELELSVNERREQAYSQDLQPLKGGEVATETMSKMLLLQLAKLHYGDPDSAYKIPTPKETVFMDWGLNPFGAGYHAWAPHYDICDVMQSIRAPSKLAGASNNVFLVGSAFSNDQAWVEGAFCTAESVLNDYLDIPSIADTSNYPLICGCR
jgi:hypothetical protein